MVQNKKTSEKVASISGRILEMSNPKFVTDILWNKIHSVAASALTQASQKKRKSILRQAYKKAMFLKQNRDIQDSIAIDLF
jgi:predicted fused transcriptional regulator/phosphomethylpyrimidine kinase